MLTFSGSLKVFVAVEPCDMRRSFNGLHKAVVNQLREEPKSGAIFAFINKRRTLLKIEDGRIEIDNNLVENAIRPAKLGQKNWLFIGNGESGTKCAILYTIVENCRRLKINVREYLTDVLTRLPAMLQQDAAQLTPANWLAAHSGRAVATAA